jgi:DNA-binding NtrC family response regulator
MQPRVLVVDDERDVVEMIEMALSRAGFSVDVHVSGEEAIKALGREVYGLVITDIRMPDVSGLEVCRAVMRIQPDTPIIVISGYLDPADDSLELHVFKRLAKPFGLSDLISAVAEACRSDLD